MDTSAAESLARSAYAGGVDELGEPAIGHVERVAGALERDDDVVVAWLHDVIEDGLVDIQYLGTRLTQVQHDALLAVSRPPGTTYADYIRGIKEWPGPAGRVARRVKIADLEDNMTRACRPEKLPMREPGGRYDLAWRTLNDIDD